MKTTKMIATLLLATTILTNCNTQEKIDLAKLNLNEPIETLIDYNDKISIGVETMEYPYCLFVEVTKSGKYNFEGIDLSKQKIFFQIGAEKLKTDNLTRYGGAHFDSQPLKDVNQLNKTLKEYDAENKIYGLRIEMNTPILKNEILKKLQEKYGKGNENQNTENGIYWSIPEENKFIFYAPDYDRLIILNNTNLSKSCYWDSYNGTIDFGNCNFEEYTKELTKNSTKPEDVEDKPVIKIDENWNINELILGKTTETDFENSGTNKTNKAIERMLEIELTNEGKSNVFYQDRYHDLFFYFEIAGKDTENKMKNILKGYSILDFRKVEILFENGLKPGMKLEEATKLFDEKQIENYEDLMNFASINYIKIQNTPYSITLIFDSNNQFTNMYVIKDAH